jgi:hypothetical protein
MNVFNRKKASKKQRRQILDSCTIGNERSVATVKINGHANWNHCYVHHHLEISTTGEEAWCPFCKAERG